MKDNIRDGKRMVSEIALVFPKAEIHQTVYNPEYQRAFVSFTGYHSTINLKSIIFTDHSQTLDCFLLLCNHFFVEWVRTFPLVNPGFFLCIWTKHSKISSTRMYFRFILM